MRADSERLALILSRVLAGGVILAVATIAAGLLLLVVRAPEAAGPGAFEYPNAAYRLDLGRVLEGAAGGEAVPVLELGLLVLVLTPVARVAAAAVVFARSREWVFTVIAVIILLVTAAAWRGL
ncbi:MAG: hypothetical protein Kow00129_06550 [Thermoleophilia bacterium]